MDEHLNIGPGHDNLSQKYGEEDGCVCHLLSHFLCFLFYLCEGGKQVQHSSLLYRACVVQMLLLQVDLHPVLLG